MRENHHPSCCWRVLQLNDAHPYLLNIRARLQPKSMRSWKICCNTMLREDRFISIVTNKNSLSLSLTHHKIEEHERLIWRNCFNSGETKGNASLAATHQENYVEIIHDFLFSFKVFARAERSACSYAGVTDTVRCEACTYAHTRRESVSSQRRRARFTAACLH